MSLNFLPAELENIIMENKSDLEKFRYEICCKLNNSKKQVNSVTFSISRYSKYMETLHFDTFLTVKQAVERVEDYLSEPLTQEYYEKIQDDSFINTWDEAKKEYKTRGDALSGAIFLEECDVYDNELSFSIGS